MTDRGKVHADGHDTEHEAADRAGLTLRQAQQEVVALLTEYGPMTDDKLRRLLHLKFGRTVSKSGPATRRGELVDLGVVRKSRDAQGHVVKAASDLGGNMTVWEVVPEGERTPPQGRRSDHQRLAAARSALAAHQAHRISVGEFYNAMVEALG